MSEFKKIPTTPAVWSAIRAAHPEMAVFGSYSAPDGDEFGGPEKCSMYTEYGFKGCDYPTIAAETTWLRWQSIDQKVHAYWLCVAEEEY